MKHLREVWNKEIIIKKKNPWKQEYKRKANEPNQASKWENELCIQSRWEQEPCNTCFTLTSLLFSYSVVSDSLWPQTRLPCPSLSPGVCSNSCPLSQWCHPTVSSSVVPFSFLPSIFPSIRVFSNESTLQIRWPKYWTFSFSISPSNEYSGLISFRIDWLDLLK